MRMMRNQRKFRRGLSLLLCGILVFASAVSVYGGKAAEAKKEAKAKQQQSEEASRQAEEAGKKADAAEDKLEEAVTAIEKKQTEIATAEAKLAKTKKKLARKQAQVKKQEKNLNSRLVAMYKTGTVGYVDVILNSNSIDELITNMSMVQKLLHSDQSLLRKLRVEYKKINKLKKQQEAEEAKLVQEKKDLEALKEKYKDQAGAYRKQQENLQSQAESLAAEARRKQAEAERLLQKHNKKAPTNSGGYVWPCDGPLTSYYGWRTHPIFGTRTYHSGYDIAASTGTPVYAAGSGVVTMASSYGGYGNCMQIYIGNGYTTLYGHLSGFAVSQGAYVKKGQVVAYVGSTGWSTGPHLHYSLLKNGSFVDPKSIY